MNECKQMLKRGVLIAIEGSDRVGKSTQALRLCQSLQSQSLPTQLIRFPDRSTTIGQLIDQYLRGDKQLDDHVIHLLFSANRWEHTSRIKSLLTSGTNVIVDRYAYSGVAYSAAKEGMDFEWCRAPDIGLPKPDSVIYLKAPFDVVTTRNGFGDEKYEKFEFQQKVRHNYDLLIEDNWKVICADKPIDELQKELFNIVKETIESVKDSGDSSISPLWTKPKVNE